MPERNILIITPGISDSAGALMTALAERTPQIRTARRRLNRSWSTHLDPTHIINWGSSNTDMCREANCQRLRASRRRGEIAITYNKPGFVNQAANKLTAFRIWSNFEDINSLEFTYDREHAQQWLNAGAEKVYCRTTLRGNSGDGILIARTVDEVVVAPLYTKGIDIHHEFRFHVMNGVVIDGVRKAFNSDIPTEERNRDIMNHAAGTIFVRTGPALQRASENTVMLRACVRACQTLGLDFGAVDVLVDRQGQYHIIEINTACGLEGTTLDRYHRGFVEMIEERTMTPWSMGEFGDNEAGESLELQEATEFGELSTPAPPVPLTLEELATLASASAAHTLVEQTQSNTNTQGSNMNISEAIVGNTVTFTPESNNSIGSLTPGQEYTITRVGNSVVYVRNNRGRIQSYQVRHFQAVVTDAAVATVATVELVGNEDGSIDISLPADSPERVVLLSDGSSVNASGTATFSGTSRHIEEGEEVTIHSMLQGERTGDVFLGVEIGEHIYRYIASRFSNGVTNTEELPEYQEGATTTLRVNDIVGRRLAVGRKVQVRVSAGGHGLTEGTLAEVTEVTAESIGIRVEGQAQIIHIQPNRIAGVTQSVFDRIISEHQALQSQETMDFTVDGNNYRILTGDRAELRAALLRFTV